MEANDKNTSPQESEIVTPDVPLYSFVSVIALESTDPKDKVQGRPIDGRQGIYVANLGDGTAVVIGETGTLYKCKALIQVPDRNILPGTKPFVERIRTANQPTKSE